MMEERKAVKHKIDTVEELRAKRRREASEQRKEQRQSLMDQKRMRFMSAEGLGEDFEFTEDLVKEMAKKLVEKKDVTKELLQSLRKAMSQGSLLIDAFWSVEGALTALTGILTGSDADLQLDATWCLTNMAGGTHEHASAVLKEAGPYLITYLSSGNTHLQDQCAWALGNIAGDSSICRDTVIEQGMLKPTIKLLQSPSNLVVRSAAFALSNLARSEGARTQLLIDEGILQHLKPHLKVNESNTKTVSEAAWVLTYIAASGNHTQELLKACIPEALAELLVDMADKYPNNFHILTPALRCLGNLCAGPEEMEEHISGYDNLIPALHKFLKSEHRFIRKECLWSLSNMTGNAKICKSIVANGLIKTIVSLLSQAFDIKIEAAYTICNLACVDKEYVQAFLDDGAMESIVHLIKGHENEVIHSALCFIEMACRTTENGQKLFEASGGLDGLELLEYHTNDVLRQEANQLLDTYFYKEDGERSRKSSPKVSPKPQKFENEAS